MKKGKKKVKIRYDRIIMVLIILIIIGFIIYKYFDRNLKNIYISGNTYLSDQTIIKIAKINNYPKMININNLNIKEKLLENSYIDDVDISKKSTELHIKIKEAHPIYLDSNTNKTILSNGNSVDDIYILPTLINYVPDTIVKDFNKAMGNVKNEILIKISEIKYDPNIDSERFLLTMTDGNYVYININRFDLINNYLTIISNFKDQKGIVYLDSGSHFELFKKS